MHFRYPIFLDLSGKRCLVTGEHGELAAKVEQLLVSGAKVLYVNPRAAGVIADLAKKGVIDWQARPFAPADLDGCFLVLSALPDSAELFHLAEERNVLCNAADDPEHCRFIFGSTHRQGDFTIAASTNGAAPALAVRLKERFQREIGPEYAVFVDMLKQVRGEIKRRIPDFAARRELWYRMVDSSALEKIRAGNPQAAREQVRELIENAAGPDPML
jgi:siroheme synthase-like protein